jgi:hypothetical protein
MILIYYFGAAVDKGGQPVRRKPGREHLRV